MTKKRQILRADTSAGWALHNPPLALNELVFDTNVQDFKRGDGVRHFSQLPFLIRSKVGNGAGLLGSTITRWEAKTYEGDLMVVLFEDNIYYVSDDTPRPFDSSDFLDEYDRGLWTLIGGSLSAQPADNSLWLLTEDGRKITDEHGKIITVN
jgi:hypothetical protein